MISPEYDPKPVLDPTAGADLDEAAAVERIGDRNVYLEITHFFGANLPQSMASLAEALEKGDAPQATRLAHSLKGNCATVGAEAMREQCYALERLCREERLAEARQSFAVIAPSMLALGRRLLLLR